MAHYVHIVEASATGVLSMLSMIVNEQVRAGNRVDVLYSNRDSTPTDFINVFGPNVNLIHCNMNNLAAVPSALLVLRGHLASFDVDALFLHSSIAGFLGRVCLFFLSKKPNLILYFPHCISFMRKDINIFKKFTFVGLEWIACMTKATYVACSKSESIEILRHLPRVDLNIIENAIKLDDFKFKAQVDMGLSFDIVTVGEIRLQKNPSEFCAISHRILTDYPSLKIAWIGDGDTEMKSALSKSGVKVLGWKSREQVIELVSSSKVYLSTSSWEGLPVALIEATVLGIPILSSAAPGNVDIVSHGENGLIYQSVDDAAQKAVDLVYHCNDVISPSAELRDSSRYRFSSERYLIELSQLIYRSLVP